MLRRRQRQQKRLLQNSSVEVGQQVSSMKRIMLFFDFRFAVSKLKRIRKRLKQCNERDKTSSNMHREN